jgi:hypothetical protein
VSSLNRIKQCLSSFEPVAPVPRAC